MIFSKIQNFIYLYNNLKIFLNELSKILDNKNIVVIGSSKILTDSKLGKKIDKHDLVVRFNLAPTRTHEKDVGKKTDIIVLNHLFFCGKRFNKFHLDIKKIKKKIIIVINDHNKKNYSNYLEKNKYNYCNESNKVIIFNNNLNSLVRFKMISKINIFKKLYYYSKIKKYSGGLLFLSFLKILKCRFNFFGFDLNKRPNKVDYYYKKKGWNKKKSGTSHDFEKENFIIKKNFL